MATNYQNGKIYYIVCDTTGLKYYGSTTKKYLSARLGAHIYDYNRYLKGLQNYITSYKVLENKNYKIVLVENYSCNSKDELLQRERYYIENNDCVNKCVPIRLEGEKAIIDKEYRIANATKIKEYKKEYFQKNKPEILEKNKEYYIENKVAMTTLNKIYRESHKEEIKKHQKEYADKNKEHISEYQEKYRELKKDETKAYQKEYREKNKEKLNEYLKQYRLSKKLS
jgi:hypothetical protein